MKFIKKIIVSLLILESRLVLAKYKPFIVAVTGSVGKTTTKDAVYSVLKQRGGYVRRSEKSFNSDIGIPLTILGVPNAWKNLRAWMKNLSDGLGLILKNKEYPDTLILEIGADHPGEIKSAMKWIHPDISIITRVSSTPVHVEFFKSPEQVFEEKSALAHGLKKGGTLILYGDDEKMLTIPAKIADKNATVLTFGTSDAVTIKGSEESVVYEEDTKELAGFSFKLNVDSETAPVAIKGVLGHGQMYPLLAAAAAGKARGMKMGDILEGISDYDAPKGRMNIIAGINDSIIIDDTYNSSPDAVLAALEALKGVVCPSEGQKIAVLGDMMELGKYSSEKHRAVGTYVASVVNRLITVGQRSRGTAEEAIKAGLSSDMVNSFDSSVEAAAFIVPLVKKGDVVLIKGSQSPRLERVTKALLRNPEKAGELLVRQEEEWLKR